MNKESIIYVAGHNGMVGSAIVRKLKQEGYKNIITKSSKELDLKVQKDVQKFFEEYKPEYVFLAAAKVGGIMANINNPTEFLIDNLLIETNIIKSSYENKVKKLIFLGSSCIYPKNAPQPLKEEYLLSSELEPTNEGYALAKIAGIKMCEYYSKQYNVDFISVMPCNLYGENDNFDLENAHVMASLIRKFHEAKINNIPQVKVYGSGNQLRELMYVDDLSEALLFIIENYKGKDFINIGTGNDVTIKELSEIIKDIIGYKGDIIFDTSKPDGMHRKVLDVSKINKLGWKAKISLREGIEKTYKWYLTNIEKYPLATNTWDEKELEAINRVIKSDFYTMGEEVKAFEKEFANFFGSKYAVMVNSGSSANLIAIGSLIYSKKYDLKKGDEVIVPAVSWATTYSPLYNYGLKLKFVDIDLDTLNIDLDKLENAISEKTKAIFAVNLLGNPNDFDKLTQICNNHNLILIEDNCESMGATYKGKYTGTFGVLGTFSTFYSHHICTMEGGVVVTDDEELRDILISLRAHGWTRNLSVDSQLYSKLDDEFYEMFNFILPGYNLRPIEIEAAIGREQLKKLDSIIINRQKNGEYFVEKFKNLEGVKVQTPIGNSSFFGFSIILEDEKIDRKFILNKLKENNIEFRPIVAGNFTKNKVIKYYDYEVYGILENSDILHNKGFFIGNHHYEVKAYIDKIYTIISNCINTK